MNQEVGVAPRPQPIRIAEIGERRALHQERAHVGRGQRDVQSLHLASPQRLDERLVASGLDQRPADGVGPVAERVRLMQPWRQQREHAVTGGRGDETIPLHLTGVRRPAARLSPQNRCNEMLHRVRPVRYRIASVQVLRPFRLGDEHL